MYESKELNMGRAGQYIVLADLLLKGLKTFPTSEGVNYDVVVDLNGKIIRLQVKTTRGKKIKSHCENPVYFFHLKRTGKFGKRIYQIGEFEAFALVALDIKKIFYLKFDRRIPTNSIVIRDKDIKYKTRGGRTTRLYWQDLTWEKLLSEL